jgi:hypothetical protein
MNGNQPRLVKWTERGSGRGRGRGLDRPRKLGQMPSGRGNTLVVLSRPRVLDVELDFINCRPQIYFIVN